MLTSATSAGVLDRLPPAYDVVPVAPNTPASVVAVDAGLAVGGVAVSAAYFDTWYSDSSNVFVSLSIGGGCAFNPWFSSPCYAWNGSWTPYCGGWYSKFWFAGCNTWCRPWFNPCFWYDPWCPRVCWPTAFAPSWSLCFGWGAWSSSFLWGANYLPAPYYPVTYAYPQTVVVYEQAPLAPALPTAAQAWSALAGGYDQEALSMFGQLVQANPQDAEALVGYALANSMLGFDGSGIVAMRRALAIRPEALLSAPIDPSFRAKAQPLLVRYKDLTHSAVQQQSVDAFMMVAALETILGDEGNAYFAADTAIQRGDTDPSILNLREMLRQRLSRGY